MACGSGKLIADLIAGQKPEIPTDGLAINRYHTSV
jgi:D-amino-acid dehydrogenase